MKIKVFRFEAIRPDTVRLFEEIDGVNGRPVLIECATMDGIESAKMRARELCPDGYKLRFLNV